MSHTPDRYRKDEAPSASPADGDPSASAADDDSSASPADEAPSASATDPVARVTDLAVSAPDGRTVLHDAALTLRPGQLLALTGPSGSGKTTLLRALTGLLPPGTTRTAGRVEVFGQDVFALSERELRALRRERLAYVGQDPGSGLNPRMRVRSLLRELSGDRTPEAVRALLAEVRLPDDDGRLAARRPAALSGGQQRRVTLARALARRPRILLLDEPAAGLHPELRDDIGELLLHLAREHQLAIALSCHDRELVERIADEVVDLTAPYPRPLRGAGNCATSPHEPAPARTTELPELSGARGSKGHSPWRTGRVGAAGATPSTAPVLAVDDLRVTFARRRSAAPALDGVALRVAPGAATGIVGASGSGKTTLVRAVVGLQPITAGTISLDGVPLSTGLRGRSREERRRIQLVTQNPLGALNPSRTVGAAIGRPMRLHRRCPTGEVPARVTDLLEQVGLLPSYADRYPHELSGGQRQRVAIARALAADPDVLICDEVTSALDSTTAEAIMDLLVRLREERGTALVLISHDLPLIADRTDTVTVLDAGRAVESGRTADIFTAPSHPATKALLRLPAGTV
ncbi:ATP-binding cassette domain-containing protein [Streptomyces caniscabiei]|uniref:ABC transporter ATP-binding protein n=3 Tax=Streptomyces caniscabiei TaxID=2746961 RepID=UPI0029B005E6|nr:ATP-binding cassette domain-containing protein [Streptomyces caniscabiei]MDX2602623.1 ATP-binding cassette domain-containing protein [Streptomyces caniscabiei]MDX2734479.1 ATP-binding cassette domain-containing protein [Streptomyces caniscabiei]